MRKVNNSAINPNILAIRGQLSLTQEQLASLLKVNKMTVYNWEHGLTKPNKTSLTKLKEFEKIHQDAIYPESHKHSFVERFTIFMKRFKIL